MSIRKQLDSVDSVLAASDERWQAEVKAAQKLDGEQRDHALQLAWIRHQERCSEVIAGFLCTPA